MRALGELCDWSPKECSNMRARRGRTELQRPQAHFTDRRLALRWPQRSQTSSRALVAPTRAGSSHHRRARLIIRGSARLFDGTFTPRKANRASRDKFCGARAVEVQLVPRRPHDCPTPPSASYCLSHKPRCKAWLAADQLHLPSASPVTRHPPRMEPSRRRRRGVGHLRAIASSLARYTNVGGRDIYEFPRSSRSRSPRPRVLTSEPSMAVRVPPARSSTS